MFGPLGGQEFILILVLALLLFGPRKLPQVGRSLGRALAEFRGATNDFKRSLEREIDLEEVKEARDGLVSAGQEVADAVRDADRAGATPRTVEKSTVTAGSEPRTDAEIARDRDVPPDREDAAPPARSRDGEPSEQS